MTGFTADPQEGARSAAVSAFRGVATASVFWLEFGCIDSLQPLGEEVMMLVELVGHTE